jgi:hypothetical protein
VFHGAHIECHLWLWRSRGRLGLALQVLLGIRRICLEQPQARRSLNVEDLIIIRLHLQDSDLGKCERYRRLLISELNLFYRCVDCGVGCSGIPELLLESSPCLLSLVVLFFNHFDVVHYRLQRLRSKHLSTVGVRATTYSLAAFAPLLVQLGQPLVHGSPG